MGYRHPLVTSWILVQTMYIPLNVKERLAASGGGHTLRCCDLGMILTWRGNGVCDGGHSADVMKTK